MKGVQFLVDDEGNETAVLINLKTRARLWEDFHDSLLAHSREKEPLASVK